LSRKAVTLSREAIPAGIEIFDDEAALIIAHDGRDWPRGLIAEKSRFEREE
jgi:hypothetical protein